MGLAVATIVSEGRALDPAVDILALEVHKALDRIPEARLTIRDGSVATRDFAVSNAAFFAPGKQVQIRLRYEGEVETQVFEGLVVRHTVEARRAGTELRIELKDATFRLTRGRRYATHRDQSDADIVQKLASRADLRVGTIDATSPAHKELVQYYASDWDFILARADVNGQVIIVDDGALSARAMSAASKARARLEFGLDTIHEFELELDTAQQWGELDAAAWDSSHQALADPVKAEELELAAGNLELAAVADKLGGGHCSLILPAPLIAEELGPWASARLARSRLSLHRGRVLIDGRADIKPFDRIELGGVGDRFKGEHLVSGVVQRFGREGWRTELVLGLSPEWFARAPDLAEAPAGGLLPPVTFLQIGVVDGFEDDPDGEKRIKVRLPGLDAEQGAVWARLARPDAGKDRGFSFWPEPDDEVVVGFLAGDPRQAVVLGALYGSVNTPPKDAEGPSEDNKLRAIVSKAGTTILFDDDKPAITVKTAKANTIVLDDDAEEVTITDQHGNKITMSSDGLKLESAGDFTIDASGKVVIKGSSVDIQ